MVEARAVRKAVTSSAFMRPVVLPCGSNRVRDPRIVWTVLSRTSLGAPEASPSADTSGKLDELAVVSVVAVVLIVLILPLGLSDPDVGLRIEEVGLDTDPDTELLDECCVSKLKFSSDGKFWLLSGCVMLMTLTPWLLHADAGMKSVVEPSLRTNCVRSGWKSEPYSFSSAEVLYQCRASERDCWRASMSDLVKEWRMRLTSRSVRTVRGIVGTVFIYF